MREKGKRRRGREEERRREGMHTNTHTPREQAIAKLPCEELDVAHQQRMKEKEKEKRERGNSTVHLFR